MRHKVTIIAKDYSVTATTVKYNFIKSEVCTQNIYNIHYKRASVMSTKTILIFRLGWKTSYRNKAKAQTGTETRAQLLPRCLVCLPCAMSFPVALLVRSTVANARVRPCFRTWAVMSTSSPILAAFMYLQDERRFFFPARHSLNFADLLEK